MAHIHRLDEPCTLHCRHWWLRPWAIWYRFGWGGTEWFLLRRKVHNYLTGDGTHRHGKVSWHSRKQGKMRRDFADGFMAFWHNIVGVPFWHCIGFALAASLWMACVNLLTDFIFQRS